MVVSRLAMSETRIEDKDLAWVDARAIGLEGCGFTDTASPYDRLPRSAQGAVTEAVWSLQQQSAGLCVRFRTSAPEVGVRWSLLSAEIASSHMAATGVSGVDLYAEIDGRARFVGVGRPSQQAANTARLPGSDRKSTRLNSSHTTMR
jgi:hypothetical protein